MAPPLSDRRRRLRWPWPAAARLLVGAVLGWAVVQVAVSPPGPDWRGAAAAVALAAAALAATVADRWAPRGLWPGLALASVAGVYAGVPETSHVRGLAAGLAVLWLADATGRLRMDGLVLLAVDVALVWVAVWGAVQRPGALVGGLAILGLLLVAPLAERLPGPRRAWLAPRWQVPALLGVQLVVAVAIARWGALQSSALVAAVVGVLGLATLAWLSRLMLGPRPW